MNYLSTKILAAAALALSLNSARAYERLQGLTEVLHWNKTNAYVGYTFFGVRSNTYLLNMEGRVVHSWPLVRAIGRARLNRDGSLTVIGWDNLVKEYDWHGALAWHYRLAEGSLPHHDFVRLENGNYLILAQETKRSRDYLQEVARDGKVVWEWEPAGLLDRSFCCH